MIKLIQTILIFSLALAGLTLAGCKGSKKSTVTIGTKTWNVELAVTDAQKYHGLSGRMTIKEDDGMLFIERQPVIMRYCMRDCYVPIDIIFIGADKKVVNTYAMQVETDKKGSVLYSSQVPAKYAFEVAGGSIKKYNIKIGDPVLINLEK